MPIPLNSNQRRLKAYIIICSYSYHWPFMRRHRIDSSTLQQQFQIKQRTPRHRNEYEPSTLVKKKIEPTTLNKQTKELTVEIKCNGIREFEEETDFAWDFPAKMLEESWVRTWLKTSKPNGEVIESFIVSAGACSPSTAPSRSALHIISAIFLMYYFLQSSFWLVTKK